MFRANSFKKRSYTFRGFVKDLSLLIANFPQIIQTMKGRRISRQFAERIMLAVTVVNGCKYCAYGHVATALKSGVSEEEIEFIMKFNFDSCNPEEVVALAFAQHYAESKNSPSEEAKEKVVLYYGLKKAKDIFLFIQIVSLGNLLGNTIEAFEARKKGMYVENSSLLFESFAYIVVGPIFKLLEKMGTKIISSRFKNSKPLFPQ